MIDKVLITTSGIGSRLGNLTNFTNKCLVRIGNKPAISHIIESYPSNFEFIITLGHYGDLVQQFLELTYPDHKFIFVKVDKYRGEGSSLGYSILKTEPYLKTPFIFHACDTLFSNTEIVQSMVNSKVNFCVGAKTKDASQYATLLVSGNKLKEIKLKGELNFDLAYVGVSGIVNHDLFFKTIKDLYKKDPNNQSLNDSQAINKMLLLSDFFILETDSWLDMGNTGELKKARQFYKSEADVLEKAEESIYFFEDFVVKFFSNKEISANRVKRADYLKNLIPDITDSTENFYKYNKVKGSLLAESINEHKFKNLLNWSQKNLWKKQQVLNFKDTCYDFYVKKTFTRINKYLKLNDDVYSINGVTVLPIYELLNKIDFDWLCSGIPVSFHGDFILDNILETEKGFCLLDWRQDFSGNLNCGDIYYDLAKLNHNLTINHEIVNKKLFEENSNNCYILCNSKHIECKKILKTFIEQNGFDYKKVQLLTSIVWLNMSPLHEYPFNKFLFNFGKYNLTKVLENEH